MSREQQGEEQARRDLGRLEREREKLFHSGPAPEPDNDPMEILGRRIARILGPLMAGALLVYLLFTYGPQT